VKKLILITILLFISGSIQAAAYIKIGDIKGEAKASQKAKLGYKTLAKTHKTIDVPRGQEKKLPAGLYLNPNGKVLRVSGDGHKKWINIESMSARTKNIGSSGEDSGRKAIPRDKASGLSTGKRQHKPVTISKGDCKKGTVVRGKHKGKKCEFRGHVTVLK